MRITWERQDGWFDREYTVVDTDGTVVEKLGKHPSLDQLRETERQHGTRIQLWQAGLLCSACGNEIAGRFGADRRGHLLCWDCASDDHGSEENSLSMNIDPTDVVISSSHLYKKVCVITLSTWLPAAVMAAGSAMSRRLLVSGTGSISYRSKQEWRTPSVTGEVTCCTGTISRNGCITILSQ